MMHLGKIFLDETEINRIIKRMTYEIYEKNYDTEDIVIIGINQRGYILAERISNIARNLKNKNLSTGKVEVYFCNGVFDIQNSFLNLKIEINNKIVILITDIFLTGRITSAAISSIFFHGCPKAIQFATLISGGHRQFPLVPNFTGKNIPTEENQKVTVKLRETDNIECVILM